MPHELSDILQIGQCNFYDIDENVSCYKKAAIREDANFRMLCDKHHKKYKKILQTREQDGY